MTGKVARDRRGRARRRRAGRRRGAHAGRRRGRSVGESVTIGIRPEHVRVGGGVNAFGGNVASVEQLGGLSYVRLAEPDLTVQIAGQTRARLWRPRGGQLAGRGHPCVRRGRPRHRAARDGVKPIRSAHARRIATERGVTLDCGDGDHLPRSACSRPISRACCSCATARRGSTAPGWCRRMARTDVPWEGRDRLDESAWPVPRIHARGERRRGSCSRPTRCASRSRSRRSRIAWRCRTARVFARDRDSHPYLFAERGTALPPSCARDEQRPLLRARRQDRAARPARAAAAHRDARLPRLRSASAAIRSTSTGRS